MLYPQGQMSHRHSPQANHRLECAKSSSKIVVWLYYFRFEHRNSVYLRVLSLIDPVDILEPMLLLCGQCLRI
jgi:hypothetical protein